jgi:phage replication O-like protein O
LKIDTLTQLKLRNTIIDNVLTKYYFPSYEIRILLHIMRKTLGWNRTDFFTSFREIAKATKMPLGRAHNTVKDLNAKNIIATRGTKTKTHFELNTDLMAWKLKEPDNLFSENGVLPEQVTRTVTPAGNASKQDEADIALMIKELKESCNW